MLTHQIPPWVPGCCWPPINSCMLGNRAPEMSPLTHRQHRPYTSPLSVYCHTLRVFVSTGQNMALTSCTPCRRQHTDSLTTTSTVPIHCSISDCGSRTKLSTSHSWQLHCQQGTTRGQREPADGQSHSGKPAIQVNPTACFWSRALQLGSDAAPQSSDNWHRRGNWQ